MELINRIKEIIEELKPEILTHSKKIQREFKELDFYIHKDNKRDVGLISIANKTKSINFSNMYNTEINYIISDTFSSDLFQYYKDILLLRDSLKLLNLYKIIKKSDINYLFDDLYDNYEAEGCNNKTYRYLDLKYPELIAYNCFRNMLKDIRDNRIKKSTIKKDFIIILSDYLWSEKYGRN